MRRKTFTFLVLILFFVLIGAECERINVSLDRPDYRFLVEDVGVREVWLRLKVYPNETIKEVSVFRDSVIIFEGSPEIDTTIHDTLLSPGRDYTYILVANSPRETYVRLREIKLTTLDTTSHDFTWEVYEFPCYGSGVFNDVAIIDENDIWVVGDFEPIPYQTYNAVHWNGSRWEKRRIPFSGPCVIVQYPPISSIWAYNKHDILFNDGGRIINYDGINNYQVDCGMHNLLTGRMNKMFGFNENELYVVCNHGSYVWYNNDWHYQETGKDLNFQDIWGVYNPLTGEKKVMAIACNHFTADSVGLFEIDNDNIKKIKNAGLPLEADGIWSPNSIKWFIGSAGLYYSNDLNKPWKYFNTPIELGFCRRIRGNGLNDIFVAGNNGYIGHWNGKSWKTYLGIQASFYGLDVKGNIVVAGGTILNGIMATSAVIVVGRRQ